MSTRALSLPIVMTTSRLSFTRFLRWPRSTYKVNTGQANERTPCVGLHSATLVCGLFPLTNLIPQPFASCVGWMSPTCYSSGCQRKRGRGPVSEARWHFNNVVTDFLLWQEWTAIFQEFAFNVKKANDLHWRFIIIDDFFHQRAITAAMEHFSKIRRLQRRKNNEEDKMQLER